MPPTWYCRYCGFRDDLWSRYYWRCPECGKPLTIMYLEKQVEKDSLDSFQKLLPFTPEKSRGEGSTPMVVDSFNGYRVLFKLEYLNPSGSFKDRGSSLAIYYGYRMGYEKVVEDTSGNTGISVTLYSRIYGLKPIIVMPKTAPFGKKYLIKLMGGAVVETKDRGEAGVKVLEYVGDSYYVAHTWSFFYILGASMISYEVFEEYGVPDYVIAPVGSGGLLLGIVHGFEVLREYGFIDKIPRIIAVQGCSVHPLYDMYGGEQGCGRSDMADGIMVPNPPRLHELKEVMDKYGERIVLVNNNEIMHALDELYSMGYIVEPTSATAWAAFRKVMKKIDKGSILMPLTGSGLKTIPREKAHEP